MTLQIQLKKPIEEALQRDAKAHGMKPDQYAQYLLEKSLETTAGTELLERWLSDHDSTSIQEQAQTFTELVEGLDNNRRHDARKLFSE
jgi:hypothetical protein